MERVQFQQEQMLAELKDFAQKGVFTQAELKQIMKKRTAFETALVRRVPKKGDFLRYASYEMSLEALRRKRAERLKLPKGPPSVSDYALVRRQFQIFERALKKFKEDVGLWIQYLQVAKREGARALVGRISARALQLHPNSPSLYILAASQELRHLSHSAARVLLQRGIRLNGECVDLWREYLKMELGFVESLRRRWEVLGLDVTTPDDNQIQSQQDTAMDSHEDIPDNSENARKEVLRGALVKEIIASASDAKPTSELFSALHSVIVSYPCPEKLRRSLLDCLHMHMRSKLSMETEPVAARLHATRFLIPIPEGAALVDGIKSANEELSRFVRQSHDQSKRSKEARDLSFRMAETYVDFVREWSDKDLDESITLYLLTSLRSLASPLDCTPLLLGHLHLLKSPVNPKPITTEKLLKLAKKYASRIPTSSDIWIFVLELEWANSDEGWQETWRKAKRNVPASVEDDSSRVAVWEWILDRMPSPALDERIQTIEFLLSEAASAPSSSTLVERLLVRYVGLLYSRYRDEVEKGRYQMGSQVQILSRVTQCYTPSPKVWESTFDTYSQQLPITPTVPPDSNATLDEVSDSKGDSKLFCESVSILRFIYNKWRLTSQSAHGEAALKWGAWLVSNAMGKEAADAISTARAAVARSSPGSVEAFDLRWREIIDGVGEDDDNEEGDDSSSIVPLR